MISNRERNYLKRLASLGKVEAERPPDLFREFEVSDRRKAHLVLVIRRQERRLKIDALPTLESLDESELHAIRFSLSKQIARAKMAAPAEEIAA